MSDKDEMFELILNPQCGIKLIMPKKGNVEDVVVADVLFSAFVLQWMQDECQNDYEDCKEELFGLIDECKKLKERDAGTVHSA